MSEACKLCGQDPAAGFAMIGDDRYCHGDFDPDPTCYMQAQRIGVIADRVLAEHSETLRKLAED